MIYLNTLPLFLTQLLVLDSSEKYSLMFSNLIEFDKILGVEGGNWLTRLSIFLLSLYFYQFCKLSLHFSVLKI